ncbi:MULTISPECIES: DUF4870 domain-containing protein [unclassified Lysobacter]|uniref:DUF4870 domain-containing protein n=1 Tax=unclassified Lysobacter TaxID=2635362 RepID=UPI0006F73B9A|nr:MULTISPECIES: DUF4870 domain-containing protein [unclassified Lysobacter]KRA21231.1 hypothetical protein ASD69_08160 [Lysobacter sp. Root604]KRD30516.1 hypothetical protein ASE35_17525 [Lysobacter sp. Root916]KRD80259.1 hypothetical protein ASE43_05170 [Lysobacter sp. Root983]
MSDINESSADGNSEDRTLALITHLSAIVAGFVVPLIIWLINKDKPEKSFLIDQAKEALNFNITLLIVYVILTVVITILTIVTLGLGSVLSILIWLVWLGSIVLFIIGGIKANNGERYRYPFALRLIK